MSSAGPGVPEGVCAFVAAFGCWVIIGAMAYKTSGRDEHTELSVGETVLLMLTPIVYLFTLALAVGCLGRVNPRANSPSLFIAAMLGLLGTSAFCIFTASWRGAFEHLFWIMGGPLISFAAELATALVGRVLCWLEGKLKAQNSGQQN